MITLRDNQKTINIRILTIYFMLSEDEQLQHKAMIQRLNRIKAFTLGLYEFKILTKLNGINSCLSEEVKASIEQNNLIVRLPNDSADYFVYAFDNINLCLDGSAVEEHIHNLVVELAKQCIDILKERQASGADNPALSAEIDNVLYSFEKAIESGVRSYARHIAPPIVRECCNESHRRTDSEEMVVTGTTKNHADAMGLLDDESAIGQFDLGGLIPSTLTKVLGCLNRHGIPESKQQMLASELADIFAEMFGVPSNKEASLIAKGIFNKTSDAIIIDKYSRIKPNEKPNIKIHIERIPYVDGRGKKRREKYGVRISVGSFERLICFEETTQTMVYVAALLRHKMGKRLYVHELRNNSAGTLLGRENAKHWLKKIYTTIIKPENSEFDKWIDSVRNANNGGKKLNTAASSTKRIVKDNLEMYPDALYYCLLISVPRSADGAYYTFNCSADDIVVCGELQETINGEVVL